SLIGMQNLYGHTKDGPNGPESEMVYGLLMSPKSQSGRIKQLIDLYLDIPSSGGIVEDHYSVYQAAPNAKNFFAGKVGIGTSNPMANLHVNGEMAVERNETSGILGSIFLAGRNN